MNEPTSKPRWRLWVVILVVAALVGGGLTWWLVSDSDGDHAHVPHLPHDAPPPVRRGPPKSTMNKVRRSLRQALTAKGFKAKAPIFMRVFKQSRELEVWVKRGARYEHFRTWPICYHSGTLGPKLKRGDFQSPEGFYSVARRQLNPYSSYHLSFNVGYPNRYDRAHRRTGSAIMVHGSCVSAGCFAMTDNKIREIYAMAEDALKGGQRKFAMHIFPFRMTKANMKRHATPAQAAFWANLKEGYDAFEKSHKPPKVRVRDRRYVITPAR